MKVLQSRFMNVVRATRTWTFLDFILQMRASLGNEKFFSPPNDNCICVHDQRGLLDPHCTKWADDQHSPAKLEPRLVPDLPLTRIPTIIDLQVIDLVSNPVWLEAETNISNDNSTGKIKFKNVWVRRTIDEFLTWTISVSSCVLLKSGGSDLRVISGSSFVRKTKSTTTGTDT